MRYHYVAPNLRLAFCLIETFYEDAMETGEVSYSIQLINLRSLRFFIKLTSLRFENILAYAETTPKQYEDLVSPIHTMVIYQFLLKSRTWDAKE